MVVGGACRVKVVGYLQRQYSNPKEAEIEFFPDRVTSTLSSEMTLEDASIATVMSSDRYKELFDQLPYNCQIELLSTLYRNYASKVYSNLSVPSDFLELSLKAMSQLASHKKKKHSVWFSKGVW